MSQLFAGTFDSPFGKNRPVSNQDSFRIFKGTVQDLYSMPPVHRIYNVLDFDVLRSEDREDIENTELFTVSSVADGAGSLQLSHIGSDIATTQFEKIVSHVFFDLLSNPDKIVETMGMQHYIDSDEEPEEEDLYDIRSTNTMHLMIQAAEMAVLKISEMLKQKDDYREYGTTFTGLVSVGNLWVVITVGDSFAVVKDGDEYTFIQTDQKSDFANVTELLTSSNYETKIETGQSYEAIFLATDGLQHASIENKTLTPTVPFWNTVHNAATSSVDSDFIVQLIEYMNKQEKIEDDTTLVISVNN